MSIEMLSEPVRQLWSVDEAKRALGLGKTSIYNLIRAGELSSVRIGRRRLVRVDSAAALIARATLPGSK